MGSSWLTGGCGSRRLRTPPLRGFTSPSESDREGLPAPSRAAAPPLEFRPLQRMRRREPTHPGFASSRFRYGRRVSHPLAVLRLPLPPGPFRPVTLLGFPPSKLLPLTEPWRLSTPSALLSLPARAAVGPEAGRAAWNGPAFRALLPARVRHGRTGFSRKAARCSLEVRRSRAFRTRVATGFPAAPLAGFRGRRSRDGPPASQGLDPQVRCWHPARPKPDRDRSPSAIFTPRSRIHELRAASPRAFADGPRSHRCPGVRPRSVRPLSRRVRGGDVGVRHRVVIRPSTPVYPTLERPVKRLR